jgi:hypothetical protein
MCYPSLTLCLHGEPPGAAAEWPSTAQVEVAFREQTAGHNALLLFVHLALDMMEDRLRNAFRELRARQAEARPRLATDARAGSVCLCLCLLSVARLPYPYLPLMSAGEATRGSPRHPDRRRRSVVAAAA